MVALDRLYEPPSAEMRAALRADIEANGVVIPIVVDTAGRIIDGYTRSAIAAELGIDCPRRVVDVTEAAAVEMAILHNSRHRRLSVEQREEVIIMLRAEGWSDRRIADVLDVHHATVLRTAVRPTGANAPVGQSVGKDGRSRPARRSTSEEVERRRDHAAALCEQGYPRDAIEKALGIGKGTLDKDLAIRGVSTQGNQRRDEPDPVDWRRPDTPPPKSRSRTPTPLPPPPPPGPEVPRFKQRTVVAALQLFAEGFAEEDYANSFGWAVTEALDHPQGAAWLARITTLVEQVTDQTGRLLRILRDDDYRRVCTNTVEGRENARLAEPMLRVVRK